jgi:hypothetical protein
MFEAKLEKAGLLKKIIDAISNLVQEVNFDCSTSGIALQAMDSAHVSLVALILRADGFEHFRCDRHMSLGINLTSLTKILKCAGNDDTLTIRAQDQDSDTVTFIFENKSTSIPPRPRPTQPNRFPLLRKLIPFEPIHSCPFPDPVPCDSVQTRFPNLSSSLWLSSQRSSVSLRPPTLPRSRCLRPSFSASSRACPPSVILVRIRHTIQ